MTSAEKTRSRIGRVSAIICSSSAYLAGCFNPAPNLTFPPGFGAGSSELLLVRSNETAEFFAYDGGEDSIPIPYSFQDEDELTLEVAVLGVPLKDLGLAPGPISQSEDARTLNASLMPFEPFEAKFANGRFTTWEPGGANTLRSSKLIANPCRRFETKIVSSDLGFDSEAFFVLQLPEGGALVGYESKYVVVNPDLTTKYLTADFGLPVGHSSGSMTSKGLVLFGSEGRVYKGSIGDSTIEVELLTTAPSGKDLPFGTSDGTEHLTLNSDRTIEYFDGASWTQLYQFSGAASDEECGGIARIGDRVLAVGGSDYVAVEINLTTKQTHAWRLDVDDLALLCRVISVGDKFVLGSSVGALYVQDLPNTQPETVAKYDSPETGPLNVEIDGIAPAPNGFMYFSRKYAGEYIWDYGFCPRTRLVESWADAAGSFGAGYLAGYDISGPANEELVMLIPE